MTADAPTPRDGTASVEGVLDQHGYVTLNGGTILMSIDEAKRIADALSAEGYVVLRRKGHEHTLRELDRARNEVRWLKERVEHCHQWAEKAFAEERRLSDRLNAVCYVAAALGVSIQQINAALEEGPA